MYGGTLRNVMMTVPREEPDSPFDPPSWSESESVSSPSSRAFPFLFRLPSVGVGPRVKNPETDRRNPRIKSWFDKIFLS